MTKIELQRVLPQNRARIIYSPWFLPAVLAILVVGVLGDILFGPSYRVLSSPTTDLANQFVYWRRFGFDQLRAGHLALWNPYSFSGTPFMGGWQAALLYPLNWTYLVLPLGRAMNLELMLHVYIVGLGMALWMRYHDMHPAAALLAAICVMFGGPFYFHVYAGHLAPIDTMAWAPYVLLATDALMSEGASEVDVRVRLRWSLLAAFALAMMVLAGHPQTLFNMVVTVVLYVGLRLARLVRQWTRGRDRQSANPSMSFEKSLAPGVVALALAGAGATAITAVQIVAGLDAAAEGTRRGGVPFAFASMFSFPPENMATAFAPYVFGDMTKVPYWGRCDLWEMCLYIGVAGLTLAVFGLIRGRSNLRGHWGVMIVILLWIALAAHTPLFQILYHYVPGFNRFRSHSKFIFEASLFMGAAAGAGLDAILRGARTRSFAIGTATIGIALVVAGLSLQRTVLSDSVGGTWDTLLRWVWRQHETYSQTGVLHTPQFISQSQVQSGTALLVAGTIAILLSGVAFGATRRRKLAYGLLVIALVDMCAFARSSVTTFDLRKADIPQVQQFLAADSEQYRILQINMPNDESNIDFHRSDLWGYDPTVLGRYAEYVFVSQGQDPRQASIYLTFTRGSKMLRLFGLKYVFANVHGNLQLITTKLRLPFAFLVGDVTHTSGRTAALSAVSVPSFDNSTTAVLENDDVPAPDPGSLSGTVSVHEEYPGCMTVTADVPARALAVLGFPYSRYWRVTPLPGSTQRSYRVVPADYAAVAIPLEPGRHRIRIEYIPAGFELGAWISGLATCAFLGLLTVAFLPDRHTPPCVLPEGDGQ